MRVAAVGLAGLLLSGRMAAAAGTPRPAPSAVPVAYLVVEAESGTVLAEKEAHLRWPPASMTKMMTVLIAMERVRDGAATLADPVHVSAWASRIGGSQVYLSEGETFPLGEMLKAIMIASANDAAVAVAFARERDGSWAVAAVPRLTTRLAPPGEFPLGQKSWGGQGGLVLPEGSPADWTNAITGEVIHASGAKGRRYALPNSTIHIHQPWGGAQGQAVDIEIEARRIMRERGRLNEILSKNTGQPIDRIIHDTDRNYYMDAPEAVEYGLIDEVLVGAAKDKEAKK